MPAVSEFHTEGAAMLKPREEKVVWTRGRGTDNRLVLEVISPQVGMITSVLFQRIIANFYTFDIFEDDRGNVSLSLPAVRNSVH